jgi:hypothetical protein
VRERPIDAPTLRRFALYLAIPLGSWFGGALVERMVDTLPRLISGSAKRFDSGMV